MDAHSTKYFMATSRWRRQGHVEIISMYDTRIALIPMGFLSGCGDNTWHYVLYAISLLVNVTPGDNARIVNSAGLIMNLIEPPASGIFRYVTDTATEVSFTRGPEYLSYFKAPEDVAGSDKSKSSASSRSRSDQSAFRDQLIGRDGVCIVSGTLPRGCEAAHVVPASRPEVYESLLGHDVGTFDVESGMLLSRHLHKEYDSLTWSLYFKDDIYYVHYFIPEPVDKIYHGHAIPLTYFRTMYEPPHPTLVAWHYAQTVRARLRGFSAGMNVAPPV